jgi:RNase P/RNase MRP subunit p29
MILIGAQARVVASTNSQLVGLTGEIVEEGRDTLRLRTRDGEKLLVKHTVTLEVNGRVIDAASLRGTHAARSKR